MRGPFRWYQLEALEQRREEDAEFLNPSADVAPNELALHQMPYAFFIKVAMHLIFVSLILPSGCFGLFFLIAFKLDVITDVKTSNAEGLSYMILVIFVAVVLVSVAVVNTWPNRRLLFGGQGRRVEDSGGQRTSAVTDIGEFRSWGDNDREARLDKHIRGTAQNLQRMRKLFDKRPDYCPYRARCPPALFRVSLFACAMFPLIAYSNNILSLYTTCRHTCRDVVGQAMSPNCTPSPPTYQETDDQCRSVLPGADYTNKTRHCLRTRCIALGLVVPELDDMQGERPNLCQSRFPWLLRLPTRAFWIERQLNCDDTALHQTFEHLCAQALLGPMPPAVCKYVEGSMAGVFPFEYKVRTALQLEKSICEEPLLCVVICALLGAAYATIEGRNGKADRTQHAKFSFLVDHRDILNCKEAGGKDDEKIDIQVSDDTTLKVLDPKLFARCNQKMSRPHLTVVQVAIAVFWGVSRLLIPPLLRFLGLLGQKDIFPVTLISPSVFFMSYGIQLYTYHALFLRFCQLYNRYQHCRVYLQAFNTQFKFSGDLLYQAVEGDDVDDQSLIWSSPRGTFTHISRSSSGLANGQNGGEQNGGESDEMKKAKKKLAHWEKCREYLQLDLTDKRMAVELHLAILLLIMLYHILRTAVNCIYDIDWSHVHGRWGLINFSAKPANLVTLFDSVLISTMLLTGLVYARSINLLFERHLELLHEFKSYLKTHPDAEDTNNKYHEYIGGMQERMEKTDAKYKQKLLGIEIDDKLLNRIGTLVIGYGTSQALFILSSLDGIFARDES